MLYWVKNYQNEWFSVFDCSDDGDYLCPCCDQSVFSLSAVGEKHRHFEHRRPSDCRPTLPKQVNQYFQAHFPGICAIRLPADEHLLKSVKAEYPDHPGRFYEFPAALLHTDSVLLAISETSVSPLDYQDTDIDVYVTRSGKIPVALVFNLESKPFDYQALPEEVFYGSSVVEIVLQSDRTLQDFKEGLSLHSILRNSVVKWIRNEALTEKIQTLHKLRKAEVDEIAQSQSENLKTLSTLNVIKLR